MIGNMPLPHFLYCMFLLSIALYMCWRINKKEKEREMAKAKDVAEVYLCKDGIVAVFDSEGKQIPEFSGKFYMDILKELSRSVTEKTKFYPSGFKYDIMTLRKEVVK